MLLSESLFNIDFLKFSLVRPLYYSCFSYPFLGKIENFRLNLMLNCKFINLDTLNNSKVLGSYAIIGVLTKQKPYISRIKIFSTFKGEKVSKYSFSVILNMSSKMVFKFLDFFYVNFLSYFLFSDFSFYNWANFYSYVIVLGDIKYSKYIERKSEFFKWKEPLYLIFFSKNNVDIRNFLNFFKI